MRRFKADRKCLLLVLLFAIPIFAAEKDWQVKAPGGSDADLEQNRITYFGTETAQVELTSDGLVLRADRLDYKQKEETYLARGNVDLVKARPKLREFIGPEIFYDSLKEQVLMDSGGQVIFGPEQAVLVAGEIHGDLKEQTVTARKDCRLTDPNGVLTSQRMDADGSRNVFTASENVVFTGKKVTVRSGTAVYYQKEERAEFKDKPVVFQDNRTVAASEIVYDIKNNKIKALGPVEVVSRGAKGGND